MRDFLHAEIGFLIALICRAKGSTFCRLHANLMWRDEAKAAGPKARGEWEFEHGIADQNAAVGQD
jgi:hypothetical protein